MYVVFQVFGVPLFFEDMCVFFWCSITKLVHFFATTQHSSKISFEFLFGTISFKKTTNTCGPGARAGGPLRSLYMEL